ncbi:MAG: hypothetical protein EXQ85_02890 [Alphaproteobacteria bacterium]|nr:hypothetical protein [Alphaproteobacteria bacterium]
MTAVTTADLVSRARDLVPALGHRVAETQSLRHIPSATIADFKAAGFFKCMQPKRYGGYELEFGANAFIAGEIARACASSAWVQTVIASHHWVVGMFPPEAQDDVWGDDADAVVASAYANSGAHAVPEGNGFRLHGTWHFASGVHAADWIIVLAPVDRGGPKPENTTVLVPKRDFAILDTWHASGLRGTGTHDVRVRDAFIPGHRELPFAAASGGRSPGSAVNPSPIYRLPMMGVGCFTVVGPVTGVAQAALETYTDQVRGRTAILSENKLADATPLQLKVAECAVEIDCARLLLRRDLEEVNRLAAENDPISAANRLRYKRDVAFAAQLCRRAVDRLVMALGVTGQRDDHPIQLASRDINALASHGLLSWDVNAIPYGRAAFGLDPQAKYV